MEKAFIERLNESYETRIEPLKEKKSQIAQRLARARVGLGRHEKMIAAQISALESKREDATAKGDWSRVEEIEGEICELRNKSEIGEQYLDWKCDLECLPTETAELDRQIADTAKMTLKEFIPQAQGEVFDAFEAWLLKADSTWDGLQKFARQTGIELGGNIRERLIPKDSAQLYGERSKQLYNWARQWGW